MTPSVRTRQLNSWLAVHLPTLGYPALHGFLCARLTSPEAPNWHLPLAGLWQGELDERTNAALQSLIAELTEQADTGTLSLPSQCRLPAETPELAFAADQPLSQWSQGFACGFANWPPARNLNDPLTMQRFSLAAELCLFRDSEMARMLHQALPEPQPFAEFLRRSRHGMKSALNTLLVLEEVMDSADMQSASDEPASIQIDEAHLTLWQQWFEKARLSRQPAAQLPWFERIIADAEPLFDESLWQQHQGYAWGEPALRPLLAARAARADCLRQLGQYAAARGEYEALLSLCLDDPMGCRYPLSSLYALTAAWDELAALLTRFAEASSWLLFNRVLLAFVRDGEQAATALLPAALAANPHVRSALLGQRRLPKQEPEGYLPASRQEADSYALATRQAWLQQSALMWLRSNEHSR
jgi:hypothetical protein